MLRFSADIGHDPHVLYTLSAIQILILVGRLDMLDKVKVAHFIGSLQQADGSFFGDQWGEIDTRFSYCALSALSLMGLLEAGYVDVAKAAEYVARFVLLKFHYCLIGQSL